MGRLIEERLALPQGMSHVQDLEIQGMILRDKDKCTGTCPGSVTNQANCFACSQV